MLAWINKNYLITSTQHLMSQRYNPEDVNQTNYIKERISLFHEELKKLKDIDRKLALGAGLDLLLWLTGIIGTSLSMVGYLGVFLYAKQLARPEQSKEFHQQLEELLKIYQWCSKDHEAQISHDKTWLSLLESLAPFVETSTLIPWNLQQVRPEALSDGFMQILSLPPHRVQFVMLKENNAKVEPGYLSHFFFNKPAEALVSTVFPLINQAKSKKYYHLFEQSVSEAVRALYGCSEDEQSNQLGVKMKP